MYQQEVAIGGVKKLCRWQTPHTRHYGNTHTPHTRHYGNTHTHPTHKAYYDNTHTHLVQRDKWPNCPATKTQFPAGQISRELKLREAGVPGTG